MVEAVDAPQTLFRAPLTGLRTFPPSKYAKFHELGQTVWISIGYEYIYFVLYILD